MEYVFRPTPYEGDLESELALALKARTERLSRGAMPGAWRITDSLRSVARPKKQRRGLLWALLLMGLFLLCTGIRSPREMLIPMLIGLLSMLYALKRLFASGKRSTDRKFRRAATILLENLRRAESVSDMCVVFDDGGMSVSAQGSTRSVPYAEFELLVETPRLYLLTYQQQATVLQKKDMTVGAGDFPAFFAKKTGKTTESIEGESAK